MLHLGHGVLVQVRGIAPKCSKCVKNTNLKSRQCVRILVSSNLKDTKEFLLSLVGSHW